MTDAGEGAGDRRRTNTHQRIIDAAQQQIGARGFRRTTISDLERAVGLRPGGGGLYRHFASKDEVLLEVVAQYTDRVRDLRAKVTGQRRSRGGDRIALADELIVVAAAFGVFLDQEAPVARLKDDMEVLPEQARRGLADAWDEAYLTVADVFEDHGVEPAQARLLATHALGSLDHFASQIASWGRSPLGIAGSTYTLDWAATWSAVAAQRSRNA